MHSLFIEALQWRICSIYSYALSLCSIQLHNFDHLSHDVPPQQKITRTRSKCARPSSLREDWVWEQDYLCCDTLSTCLVHALTTLYVYYISYAHATGKLLSPFCECSI